ncbi:MAG: sugar phosphate isomerase/epimerase [Clostridia bacterium]|nr:sugar phosphate isomerase/epimerase [Clostridia bacterium]
MKLGVQLYSVRDEMGEDFEGTLKKVKDMGYEGVEFAGLYGKSAAEVKALCEKYGLVPVSAHVALHEMLDDESVLKTYADIGCKFIAIPWLNEEDRPGHAAFEQNLPKILALAKRAQELGMFLAYHNHDFEFEKIDGEYVLDMLYRIIPAELLKAELDTCWVNVGGEDPAKYVRKYAGRVDIIHLKDFAGKKSENMYALIGVNDGKKDDTVGSFEFRPVGMGLQDMPAILKAAEESGTEWAVVEMDSPALGLTPLECIEKSAAYLKPLL